MANYIMISVTVPESHADAVREAAGKAGGGRMGNYMYGSFSTKGIGRGIALDGASPAEGEIGKIEEVVEEKIDIFCKEEEVKAIVDAIKSVHPYEGPIISATPVEIFE